MNRQTEGVINGFYLVLIGVLLGATLALGAFVAPVVFKASLFLDQAVLDTYESGRLMSEVFRRYAHLLVVSLMMVALYEGWRIFKGERGIALIAAAAAVLISGGAFAFYYTPEILTLQSQGVEATLTAGFETVHRQAEAAFKLQSFALGVLLFLRVLRLQKLY